MEQSKLLLVTDSSATELCPVRTHEIILNGELISVKFKYGEGTVLPFEQGIKFMKDGFKVEEVDGQTLNMPAIATEWVASQIDKDECIAKYSELTLASLKLRAAQKKDGEVFLKATEKQREEITKFLIGDTATVNQIVEDVIEEIDTESDMVEEIDLSEKGDMSDEDVIEEPIPEADAIATDEAVSLAAEYGIDLGVVKGTGKRPQGIILKGDVQKYIEDITALKA